MIDDNYKVGIVGGGAVGLTYAALISKAAKVSVITRQKEQAELIKLKGIQFERRSGGKKTYTGINATSDFSDIKNCDAVIIAVKSYDTLKIAKEISIYINPNAEILTLQNGIEAFGLLQANIKNPERIFEGVTYVGANRKDGRTVVNGNNLITIVDNKAKELIDVLQKTILELEITPNIKQVKWDKMVLNVGQNALSALANLNLGKMYNSNECLMQAERLLNEFKQVALAEGIHFNYDLMEKLKNNWKSSTFYPSMWQDIHAGKRTEIDAINGAISMLGHQYGIATPYNDAITKEIKELENNKL